jgi:hypothetical protein
VQTRQKAADEAAAVLLELFSGNPDVGKVRAEFDRAQKVEAKFHHDFHGVHRVVVGGRFAYLLRLQSLRNRAIHGRSK